jgi:hypothetical protein
MTLSMFIKGKVDLRHVQKWLWVCLSKEKSTSDITKYDFEYNHERKTLTLNMSKYYFSKNMLLDMSRYDFEYVYQRKTWL